MSLQYWCRYARIRVKAQSISSQHHAVDVNRAQTKRIAKCNPAFGPVATFFRALSQRSSSSTDGLTAAEGLEPRSEVDEGAI